MLPLYLGQAAAQPYYPNYYPGYSYPLYSYPYAYS